MMKYRDLRIESVESASAVGGYVMFRACDNFKLKRINVELKIRIEANLVVGVNDSRHNEGMHLNYCRYIKQTKPDDAHYEIEESKNVQFEDGDYARFKFSFPREENLPGSFEHDYGRVCYTATATLEVEGLDCVLVHADLKAPAFLDFLTDPDNLDEKIKIRKIKLQIKGNLEECETVDSRLKVTARAKMNGYLPGEKISFRVKARCRGEFEIRRIEMMLFQNVTIKMDGVQRTFDTVIARSTQFPYSFGYRSIFDQFLVIPPKHSVADVVGITKLCHDMIKVFYTVQMRVYTTSEWLPHIDSGHSEVYLATKRPFYKELDMDIDNENSSNDELEDEISAAAHLAVICPATAPMETEDDEDNLSPISEKTKKERLKIEKREKKRVKKEEEEKKKIAEKEAKKVKKEKKEKGEKETEDLKKEKEEKKESSMSK